MTEPLELLRWERGGVLAAFTTRNGGVSSGPFTSLNLGRRLGDDPACVDENRRLVCLALDLDPRRLAMNYQVHSAIVNRARCGIRGRPGDGLWTDEPATPILALAADCVPVALARDGSAPAAAVIHAGRVGVLAGVVEAGVAALGGGVSAAVGPAIGVCCYEVGEEVAEPFRARFGAGVVRGQRLDLRGAVERLLRECGVRSIDHFDACTACEAGRFYSYRRDGEPRGGQGVIAAVTG
jgi:YfiH family protein